MKTLIGVVLAMPLALSAEPIYVDYEGVITGWVHSGRNDTVNDYLSDYSIGNPISGTLKIETDLARPPTFHILAYTGLSSDFVTGFTTLPQGDRGGRFADSVSFFDHDRPDDQREGFFVTDGGRRCLCDELGISLSVYQSDGGLLSSDTLRQSFVAEPAKDGSTAFGEIWRRFGSVIGRVSFSLTRLAVTPGACRR